MSTVKDLYLALERAETPSEKIELYRTLANEFLNSDMDRCAECIDELLELALSTQNIEGLCEGYNCRGRLYFRQAKFDKSQANFEMALTYAEQIGNYQLMVPILDGLGMVLWNRGEYDRSEQKLRRALAIAEDHDLGPKFRGNVHNNLGNVYERRGDFKTAELHYKEALQMLQKAGNDKLAVTVKGNLAVMLTYQNRYRDALDLFDSVLAGFTKYNHQLGMGHTYLNMARCHTHLKETAESMENYSKAIRIFKKLGDPKAEGDAYHGLAEVYLSLGGYKESMEYLTKSMNLFKGLGYPSGVTKVQVSQGEVLIAMDKMEEAQAVLQQALELSTQKGMGVEEDRIRDLLSQVRHRIGA